MKKAIPKSFHSRLIAEIAKGADRHFESQPKTRDKLKMVFDFLEGFEAAELEKLSNWIDPKKPFKCVSTEFKNTRNDGNILVSPAKSANELSFYFNDQQINKKIQRGDYGFSFRIYINDGNGFPSIELNF